MEPSESQTVYLQTMVTLMLVLHKRKAEHNVGWSYKWVLIFWGAHERNQGECSHMRARKWSQNADMQKQKEKKKEARLRSRNHS